MRRRTGIAAALVIFCVGWVVGLINGWDEHERAFGR